MCVYVNIIRIFILVPVEYFCVKSAACFVCLLRGLQLAETLPKVAFFLFFFRVHYSLRF